MFINLNILINLMLHTYFNDHACVLHIAGSSELSATIRDYPTYLFQYNESEIFNNLKYKESERCLLFLLFIDNPSVLEDLELFIQRKSEVRYGRRRYLIFLPESPIEVIFNSSALRFISDLVVIKYKEIKLNETNTSILTFKDHTGCYEMFTHKYVGKTDNQAPILMDTWFTNNQSFKYNVNLYPDKLGNQHGRTVKVITADYIPYSHLESSTGIEMAFILEFGENYNMTLDVELTDLWGKMYANWTGTGIMGSVIMDLHDIGFSALFPMPDRILYSDFSNPTAFSRVSCVVPAPREAEGWFTHIKVFKLPMWTLIACSYASLGILVYITKTLWCSIATNTRYFSPLSLIGIFVSHPIPWTQIPSIIRLRYVYALILILTLMVATMYNSRLSSILVVPLLVNEIKTVDDLADSPIDWGELQDDWVIPIRVDDRPLFKVINKKFFVKTEDELRALSLKNKFAFGTERLLTGYYAIGSYMKEDAVSKYVVMTEDIYKQYTCLQLRKNSILLPIVNRFLNRATETGLFFYWEQQASVLHFNQKVQTALKYPKKEQGLMSLKIVHVKGVFLLWAIGLSLALLSFFHELEWKKNIKLIAANDDTSSKQKLNSTKVINIQPRSTFRNTPVKFELVT